MDVPLIFRLQECIKLVHSHCESDVLCLKEILRVFGVVFENLALANFMAVVPPSLREFGNDSVPVGTLSYLVISHFVFQSVRVVGESMYPTLATRDVIG
jgi:hypothetical protein